MKNIISIISVLLVSSVSFLLPVQADTTTDQVEKVVGTMTGSADTNSSDEAKETEKMVKTDASKTSEISSDDSVKTKKKKTKESDEEPDCD